MKSRKKLVIVAIFLSILVGVPWTVWVIVTPNWLFYVTTDKPVYNVGELIQITVTLENRGYISHSFTAPISEPIMIKIGYQEGWMTVWWSPYTRNSTTFALLPNQKLTRTFVWDQTDIVYSAPHNHTRKSGKYIIRAYIPRTDDVHSSYDYIFFDDATRFNITTPT